MSHQMIPSEATTAGAIRQSTEGGTATERSKASPVTITVRPEVAAFAEAMERKLQANDHKVHWRNCSARWLVSRLFDEFLELQTALDSGDPELIRSEAADVANFAMMIADVSASDLGNSVNVQWILKCSASDVNWRRALDRLTDDELMYCIAHEKRKSVLEKLRARARRRGLLKPDRQ